MSPAGQIREIQQDRLEMLETIRSLSSEDGKEYFIDTIIQAFFLRRIETDPAFRWSICLTIASDEEGSALIRKAIGALVSMTPGEGRWLTAHPTTASDDICTLFSEATGRSPQHWQAAMRGILYTEMAYPTAFMTAPPERPSMVHPMDRTIFGLVASTSDLLSRLDEGDEEVVDLLRETITAIACDWFCNHTREEAFTILNRRYPEGGWNLLLSRWFAFEESAETCIRAGRYAVATHTIGAARAIYDQALIRTDDPALRQICYRELGLISRNLGDAERAAAEFQTALENAHAAEEAGSVPIRDELIYLCEATDRLGLSEEGDTYYQRMIRIAESLDGDVRSRLLTRIATSCRRSRRFDREYMILEELITDPDVDEAIMTRLGIMNRAMRADGTLDTGRLSSLEDSAEGDYTLIRGILAFGAFQFADAAIWFGRSTTIRPTPDSRLWYARAAWYGDEAPLNDDLLKGDLLETRIIRTLSETKNVREAARLLLEGDYGDEAYDGLLILLEAMKDEGLPAWRTGMTDLIAHAPIQPGRKTTLLWIIGKILAECGSKEGLSIYRKALKLTSDKDARSKIFSDIGYWYETAGDFSHAADAYRQAITLHPAFPGGWYGYARALAKKGEYDAAEDAINEAIRHAPGRGDLHLFYDLLTRRKEADHLPPDLRERIDEIDHQLFLQGQMVPQSLLRRYADIVGRSEIARDELLPEMVPLHEALDIRSRILMASGSEEGD
ncbi:tetratricopeptide (TPR) repeat protein [Methanocalculus alkaliphilus]|uniref:tetratricopeptide repeat protein n=1 Tax=Methanocalculus alkaliphilus TaxID=768730 RepID=UPI00209EFEE2|nr:tetratricopeptide repeat protein [Methanocalculus alkaliphilus]MCP1714200.1 tetratricopeptide (TPR) repeat protein [Methanocalculus alkaliphilus]